MDDSMNMQRFLSTHKLPSSYADTAEKWFVPLAEKILTASNHCELPFIVGVSGCQGSGKTTLGRFIETYLASVHGKTAVSLSIDDFYLSQVDRLTLSKKIHPLFKTRGVPGTHDMSLALKTFEQLQNGTPTRLPRFDKATDNPYPVNQWQALDCSPDFIILEGWCVGVTPEPDEALIQPINNLEAIDDTQGVWRSYVNTKLAGDYQTLFAMLDYQIMLKAPSFDCVFNWRLEQEQKLADSTCHSTDNRQAIMTEHQVATFIQHYQRLTEHALKVLPKDADTVFFLDETRTITTQKISE